MRVREIHFNHDRASHTSDAINLRYDADTLITAPEWVEGEPPKPVAYIRSARPITVKVRFGGGPPNRSAQIAAAVSMDNPREVPGVAGAATGVAGLKPQTVNFDGAGRSGLITFEASGDFRNVPVGAFGFRLSWRMKHEIEWREFATTRHLVYIILAHPTHPWTTAVVETPVSFFPWVKALDKACDWAAGATTIDEAIANITTALNSHPKHTYDSGAHQFVRDGIFLLSDYLHELDYATSFPINCRGITSALTTFANLMGATLCPLVLDNSIGGGFSTNPIETFTDPNFAPDSWIWHEIALRLPLLIFDSMGGLVPGAIAPPVAFDAPVPHAAQQLIYDALVHFDPLAPTLPIKVKLGTPYVPNSGYRDDLVATGNADDAIAKAPRPVV